MRQLKRHKGHLILPWGILLFLLCRSMSCFSQMTLRTIQNQYNFSSITINDGLPHNYIEQIYKDSQGFLWFSTHNGLSRYDGSSFITYNIASPTVRLRSNFISGVCEDAFNRLWIASEAGLSLLDLKTNRLEAIDYSLFKSEDLSKEPVNFIIKDLQGDIWLTTQANLYHLSFNAEGKVVRCAALMSKYDSHSAPVTALGLSNTGEVWLGYKHNLYKVVYEEGLQLRLQQVKPHLSFDELTNVNCFCSYAGALWMGTNQGLYRVDSLGVKSYRHEDADVHTVTQDEITALAVTQNEELVVATTKGLSFYHRDTDDFVRVVSSKETMERLISCNLVRCLYADGSILWIGTEIGGICKMESRNLHIRIFANEQGRSTSLPDNPVNCIYEDSHQNVWVANIDQGLSVKRPGSDDFIHFHRSNAPGLNQNTIHSIVEDHQGNLWAATWGGGVCKVSRPNASKPSFTSYTTLNTSLPTDYVGALCRDSMNGGLWIGTTLGLCFWDWRTDVVTQVPLPTDAKPNNSLTHLLIDSKQRLWVGSHHGLIVLDLYSFARNRKNVHYQYLEHKLDNPSSGLIEKICCIFEASDGTIWLGSNGYGVYWLKSDRQFPYTFENRTVEDGLCDNTIYGILEDRQARLWLSTNHGLACYSPSAHSFSNYYQKDGLLSDQFYWNAFCKAREGLLYFGGLNGMLGLEDVSTHQERPANRPVFTRLSVLNNAVEQGGNRYLKENISWAKELHLHERDKSFSIDYSSLDFENEGNLKYYYQLVGFDENWMEGDPKRHSANYTNLKNGSYLFRVKARNPLDMADSPVSQLAITVSPYFYKTWWFIGLVLLLVLFVVFRFYQWRISILKEQKRILTEKVKERTLELEDKMEVLSKQNDQLTLQKQQLVELSKRIQEVTADKIAFFTNITHEFRTPITLIVGPLDKALKLSSNPLVMEQLAIVKRNSHSLLSLVNQLLDFRKVESGKVVITKKRNNLPAFISEVMLPFEAFAAERQITVSTLMRLSATYYEYDEEWMRRVIVNLLSNAIKFTPNGGKVSVYVCSFPKPQGANQLYLSVSDTGIGILPDDLEKIFDRFYQARGQMKFSMSGQSGTGIGLYLCKRIINEHGGQIYAHNNKGGGSSMRIMMLLEECETQTDPVSASPQPVACEEPDASATVNGQESSAPSKTILVVDDNKDMRVYVRSILHPLYAVLEAGDGGQALAVLHEKKVDFIITDLMMPVMDGIELSRRVKDDLSISHIPLLILTAKVSEEARLDSFRIGADEYLQKPFSEELLLVRIQNIFNARQLGQQQFDQQMTPASLPIVEGSRDSKFMATVMEVIEAHYSNPEFDVEAFATAMGVSKTLLNQKLQSLLGQSIAKFVGNYRLKKAQQLILASKSSKTMNVSDIAYEVGFNDPKYFSRCYQKKYGLLPSASLEGES